MIKVALLLMPILVTGSVFLILYNNVYSGRLILAILMFLNLGVVLAPARRGILKSTLPWAKVSSLCLIGGLAAVLALEILFPRILPHEYDQVLDLSKSFLRNSESLSAANSVVFNNADQRIHHATNLRDWFFCFLLFLIIV